MILEIPTSKVNQGDVPAVLVLGEPAQQELALRRRPAPGLVAARAMQLYHFPNGHLDLLGRLFEPQTTLRPPAAPRHPRNPIVFDRHSALPIGIGNLMIISIPKETIPGEHRAALVIELRARLGCRGHVPAEFLCWSRRPSTGFVLMNKIEIITATGWHAGLPAVFAEPRAKRKRRSSSTQRAVTSSCENMMCANSAWCERPGPTCG